MRSNSVLPWILATLLFIGIDAGWGRPAPSATEAELAQRIERFLSRGDRMEGASLTVAVRDHVAILGGRVATMDQAEWAAAVCYATDEVYGAVQRFEVDEALYDAASARDSLQHMFDHAPGLEGTKLKASALAEPKIVISGEAGDLDEIELAREMATRLAGVREVKVTAILNPIRPRPATAIEAQLGFKVLDDPLLAGLPVRFSVRNHKLRIVGEVGCHDVRQQLILQSMIGGIQEVDHEGLRINPELREEGMGDKRYHPEDCLKVLDLVFGMDPRLDGVRYRLRCDRGRVVVSAPAITRGQVNAMIDDSRGLPGAGQVVFPLPGGAGEKALSQR